MSFKPYYNKVTGKLKLHTTWDGVISKHDGFKEVISVKRMVIPILIIIGMFLLVSCKKDLIGHSEYLIDLIVENEHQYSIEYLTLGCIENSSSLGRILALPVISCQRNKVT